MIYLNERQNRILELLHQQGKVTISAIQEILDIPTATIYRDVHRLVEAGVARKIRGGLALIALQNVGNLEETCHLCAGKVNPRTAFTLQLEGNQQLHACCPHCGLMLLDQTPQAISAMATDYLYGSRTNVRQTTYLVGAVVRLCCTPSVLAFADEQDAHRFSQGFGGQVLTLDAALAQVRKMMSLDKHIKR